MRKILTLMLLLCLMIGMAACGDGTSHVSSVASESALPTQAAAEETNASQEPEDITEASEEPSQELQQEIQEEAIPAYVPTEEELSERAEIEAALDLRNNPEQAWTYSAASDAWVLSPVTAVTNPELPDQQGVSVAVPGAYITGVDTDGDGQANVTDEDGEETVNGNLVINFDAKVFSSGGQTYTASTCPVILTTGAAGYGSQYNSSASSTYCSEGYVSVSCGNRGKQDYVSDDDGKILYYTGDAPCCLVDQKDAVRFVKYNMLLGNLPGCVDYFVSTGGSGGAAHAAMYAATGNHPDFYDYQIQAGAVGVYQNSDGSYCTEVTINGEPVEISDGVWGAIPYSAITPLFEGDMAQAFEYYMDTTYSFNTPFQKQLAEYLSEAYMTYINDKGYTVEESAVGFDLNSDGDLEDLILLTIEYDPDKYPETNGYGGSYLVLYLCEFQQNLRWYLDNLPYADGWTWFSEDGNALSNDMLAAMSGKDLALAFLEGRYSKGSAGFGGPGGMGGPPDMMGPPPDMMGPPPDMMGGPPNIPGDTSAEAFGGEIRNGGPNAGSTQSNGSGINSNNYATFEDMLQAYESDIAEIQAGDTFGKNIVDLYNPMNYIGDTDTDDPAWTRIVMGAVEGDMPMMTSLNMEIAWIAAGTRAEIEWQWDGGHVPNEVLGESLALYVDQMYGELVSGVTTKKPAPKPITENGDSEAPSGKDLTDWVNYSDDETGAGLQVSFTLADVLKYRNAGAMKAVPGFDTIDYGQEDYVFGSPEKDARHWDSNLLTIFQNEEYRQTLSELFNAS